MDSVTIYLFGGKNEAQSGSLGHPEERRLSYGSPVQIQGAPDA